MKNQKYILIITSFVSGLALLLAVLFHCCEKEFEASILIGVFSSGFLAMLVSIIEYANKRRNTLERFYSEMGKILHAYNQYHVTENLNVAVDTILMINNVDYSGLDWTIGDMGFFFHHNKTMEYIQKNLYQPTVSIRNEVTDASWHLKRYKSGEVTNETAMWHYVGEMTRLFIISREEKHEYEPGVVTTVTFNENQVYRTLIHELQGRYYSIMYPNYR